jgi:hypothetical protein
MTTRSDRPEILRRAALQHSAWHRLEAWAIDNPDAAKQEPVAARSAPEAR